MSKSGEKVSKSETEKVLLFKTLTKEDLAKVIPSLRSVQTDEEAAKEFRRRQRAFWRHLRMKAQQRDPFLRKSVPNAVKSSQKREFFKRLFQKKNHERFMNARGDDVINRNILASESKESPNWEKIGSKWEVSAPPTLNFISNSAPTLNFKQSSSEDFLKRDFHPIGGGS